MGNIDSTTAGKGSRTTIEPVPKIARVQGSVHRNYEPAVRSGYGTSMGKNDKSYNDSHIPPKTKVPKNSIFSSNRKALSLNQSEQQTPTVSIRELSLTTHKETSTPISQRKPSTSAHSTQPTYDVLVQNDPTVKFSDTDMTQRHMSESPSDNNIGLHSFHNASLPHAAAASTFERAPKIQLNYVARPPDGNSMHIYESDHVTVVHRTTSQSMPYGNRWYDNDYNKVKPFVLKYF